MERKKNIIYLSLLVLFACTNLNKNNTQTDQHLAALLENNNFFKLNEALDVSRDKLPEDRFWYFSAHCANAFADGKKSNEYADLLLNKYKEKLHDSVMVEILKIKAGNYSREYQYKKAADQYQNILENYKDMLDSAEADEYANDLEINKTLATVKPQKIHLESDIEIQANRNRFHHLMVPVKAGAITDEFIFDTGAGISTISESRANRMGFTIYETNIDVWSSNDITIKSKLAVADTLFVEDLMFENVVFLVMPDEQLSFPTINYEIHGIVGFPVIRQMGEVHMYKNGKIEIPKEKHERQFKNMYLDGFKPIIEVFSENDTLLFILDTGANGSELYKGYYERHKEKVESGGSKKSVKRGGAGGMVDVEEYRLRDFPYTIGSKSNVLPEISVVLSENTSKKKGTDGNLGQNVILQFNKMILNFEHMYVDFE